MVSNDVKDTKGRIFDIKRFAVHDGPGIRTTVFLKGCPLRCVWCHNPEGIRPEPELVFLAEKCIGCEACIEVCPHGAYEATEAGERIYHRDRCDLCGRCLETCYAEALVLYGRQVTVENVMAEVCKDAAFYENSGGGVTLSGGEPLMQSSFACALLRESKAKGFHTAIDTCGLVDWETLEAALPYVDLVLYDLKHIDSQLHRQYTGMPNHLILENLFRLSRYGASVEIRMPIIPTINDTQEYIESAALCLEPLENIAAVKLLAYHRLSGSKYQRLGRKNTLPDVAPPSPSQMQKIAGWIERHGLKVLLP